MKIENPIMRPTGHDSLSCQRSFAGRLNEQPLPFNERCHVCDQLGFKRAQQIDAENAGQIRVRYDTVTIP